MSFASEMKNELTRTKRNECCKMAELSALLHSNSEILINSEGTHIVFQTMNNSIARCFISLVKELYQTSVNIMMRRHNLTKQDIFIVTAEKAKNIIEEQELINTDYQHLSKFIKNECCKKAYLRGAFLAMGSINNPHNSYHLEIKCRREENAILIQSLMSGFHLNAKITKRRKELIVYLKEVQGILDFVYIIGAPNTYFTIEGIRVNRDVTNMINRKVNCEIANEEKTVIAAKQQLDIIEIIEKKYSKIDEKLVEIIELRKNNPVASYRELLDIYEREYGKKLTKSGLNHRFRKLHEMAIEESHK